MHADKARKIARENFDAKRSDDINAIREVLNKILADIRAHAEEGRFSCRVRVEGPAIFVKKVETELQILQYEVTVQGYPYWEDSRLLSTRGYEYLLISWE